MRIALLWTGLSGYLNACLKELAARQGVELFVSFQMPVKQAPFDAAQFAWLHNQVSWCESPDGKLLQKRLDEFRPEILVIPSWHIGPYRQIARAFRNHCFRVMTMDHPWQATLKQRIGVAISPLYVQPLADAAWVPGDQQVEFAKRLGFPQSRILTGLYSCDQPAFAAIHKTRIKLRRPVPRRFCFIGRLVPEKGIETLIEAYRLYRTLTPDPWPLACSGTGPMGSSFHDQPGIEFHGFLQPDAILNLFANAGCLVLPSRFEPWGVVVHEAASAGLLLLASDKVGASPQLVKAGRNGFIFGSGDAVKLSRLMHQLSTLSESKLDEMSRTSNELSNQYSPRHWANALIDAHSAMAESSSR